MNEMYLSAVTASINLQHWCVVTLYTTAYKSIKQSYYTELCADFYVWVLKYSGSQYLILYLPYFS